MTDTALDERAWEKFVNDLAEGHLSILDTMEAIHCHSYQEGDYLGFVSYARSYLSLMQDPRVVRRLLTEINAKLSEITDGKQDLQSIQVGVRSKDGHRLFAKRDAIHTEMFADGPSLLTGATFEDCLAQYRTLIDHVERLWGDACELYQRERFPLCTFISILTLEEIGKLGRLWWDLLGHDHPRSATKSSPRGLGDHRKKQFTAVVSGAVINARLDRILGIKRIKQLLEDVESGKLEKLRQACLYVGAIDGRVVTPAEVIDRETAKFFIVLSGELCAEILGHFPWDFERMIKRVTDFEIEIGFPATRVHRD
jgi:AbiV family abortive infection protein